MVAEAQGRCETETTMGAQWIPPHTLTRRCDTTPSVVGKTNTRRGPMQFIIWGANRSTHGAIIVGVSACDGAMAQRKSGAHVVWCSDESSLCHHRGANTNVPTQVAGLPLQTPSASQVRALVPFNAYPVLHATVHTDPDASPSVQLSEPALALGGVNAGHFGLAVHVAVVPLHVPSAPQVRDDEPDSA